jgi:transcriptional regulator with XRE-family HTH domain
VTAFGAELERLRLERGMSRRELAARAGVSHSFLDDLAAGKRGAHPSQETIEKLAAGLDVDLDTFALYRQRYVIEHHPDLVDKAYAAAKKRVESGANPA